MAARAAFRPDADPPQEQVRVVEDDDEVARRDAVIPEKGGTGADIGEDILLMGEDEGVSAAASRVGAQFVREVRRNASGIPLISSMI